MSRFVPYIKNLVSQLNLDLSDKVIITELATNAYFDAALIPLFAGAKKVIYVDNNASQEDHTHTKKKLTSGILTKFSLAGELFNVC